MFPGFCLMCCDKGDRKEQYSTVTSIIFATLYSESGKKRKPLFCKPKAHIYSEKGHRRESRYLMLNLPLFTVGCLNKRLLKLENSIMTHNPQVFEMEQQDFVLKKNRRCALGSLFIPWCYLDSKKGRFECLNPFLPWQKIAGFRRAGLFTYTLHFGWQRLERKYPFLFKGHIMVANDCTSVVKFRYKVNLSEAGTP